MEGIGIQVNLMASIGALHSLTNDCLYIRSVAAMAGATGKELTGAAPRVQVFSFQVGGTTLATVHGSIGYHHVHVLDGGIVRVNHL